MTQRVIKTGDVGTGKTALAQRFGEDITLEAGKRGLKLRYIHVNCREYRGKLFLILQHALAVFRPTFPSRGYSTEEVLSTLMQVLDEENAHAILCLDEFDTLIEKEGSETVYSLTRIQEMRTGKSQRISLLCILRSLKAIEGLDASARSTLQRNVISLERYDKTQLKTILNDRVSLAFENGTVAEEVVDLIAELAVSESGNARFAIELLWRAGKYADVEDDIIALNEGAKAIEAKLLDLVAQDAEVFAPLAAAYKNPDDKKTREQCLLDATTVPMEIMRECCKAIELLQAYSQKGSKMALSDAGAGAAILSGALKAASLNVFINTASLSDREKAESFNRETNDMLKEYCALADRIFASVKATFE
jgi:formiminotetrahydrofolate cyclodeaminase